MTKPKQLLIVDDNRINRLILSGILGTEYEPIEAENGNEALKILERSFRDICAVLLDLEMPEMNGFELLERMREDAGFAALPVIVVTQSVDTITEARALALGANDFVSKPYHPEIIRYRLRNAINLCETAAKMNAVKRDELTGLLNRGAFFEKAAEMIAAHEPGYYVLACFDIDHFKVINDQYGTEKGDEVLCFLADLFADGFGAVSGICSRIAADNFVVLYPESFRRSEALETLIKSAAWPAGLVRPISFSIGRYLVEDKSLSVSAMCDRASLAKASVKGRYNTHIAEYNASMRDRLLHEQKIVTQMKGALENGQFELWLQPQVNYASGALVGAEALVRWRSPEDGRMISPGDFIPVFERNGFIYEMDRYVWERSCSLLRKWLDEGAAPLPVSINVSRYDVFQEDFYAVLTGLVEKYELPVDLLRLEITETAFAQSTGQIISMVKRLIAYGFTVEIDDFGSGYSSLNTLKDVPASILKLDMKFLENTEDSERGGNIHESIVRMGKWLGMSIIAEGVETAAQADYLKSIGCVLMQGYYFARPMPVCEYEALAAKSRKEMNQHALETIETLDNSSFWNPDSMDTLIFNSCVGAACVFEYHDETLELLRVNDKYVQEFGASAPAEEILTLRLTDYMDETNREAFFENLRRSIDSGAEATCETVLAGLPGEEGNLYLRATMRLLARAQNRFLLYCSILNTTMQRRAEEQERTALEQLHAIMENMNGGILALSLGEGDEARLIFANNRYYSILGYTKEQFDAEVKTRLT